LEERLRQYEEKLVENEREIEKYGRIEGEYEEVKTNYA